MNIVVFFMAKQQLQEQTQQHALAEYVQILKTGAPRDENGGVGCHKKIKAWHSFLHQVRVYVKYALEAHEGIHKHGQLKYQSFKKKKKQ